MSGQEPTRTRAKTKSRAGARADAVIVDEQWPKLLIPTPAQLAAGQRVILAQEETWCQSVASLVRKATRYGWAVSVTYSHFLDRPAYQGKWKGTPKPVHDQTVRLLREADGVGAYASWHGVEGDGWAAQGGQAKWLGLLSVPLSATVIDELVTGKVTLTREEGQGVWHAAPASALR